jgi:hypothetical protein
MRLPVAGDALAIFPPCRFEAVLVNQAKDCRLSLKPVKAASRRRVGLALGMTGQFGCSVGSAIRATAV